MQFTGTTYQKNAYYASSSDEGFPKLHRLTKNEYRESSEFKGHKFITGAKNSLLFSITVVVGGVIALIAGVFPHLAFTITVSSAGALGAGSGAALFAKRNFTQVVVKDDKLLRVRWKDETLAEENSGIPVAKKVKALVMPNSKETFLWKKKLIQNAEKRVVLSGNYCGGDSFDEILEIIEKRMQERSELKVVIISSSKFVTQPNWEKINRLTELYPNRFQLVKSDDFWMDTTQGLKKITNHTKGLVVDGKHFIMGGSGIEDKYAFSEGVGDSQHESNETTGMLNLILPRGFRDMDFVFTGSITGRQIDHELLKLARIWEQYNDTHGQHEDYLQDTVVGQLLHNAADPRYAAINIFGNTSLPDGDFRLICSGPEMDSQPFGNALYEEIKKAERHIFIDHMYFHPTKKLLELLIDKVNAGVRLTIVTNGNEKFSPIGHCAFGPRNRYRIGKLYAKVNENRRKLIEVYEYGQSEWNTPKQTTLHKKVVVVDDSVIAGSSNLGYKSTVTSSDHEMNFILQSKKIAEETIRVIEDDAFRITREVHKNLKGDKVVDENGKRVLKSLSRKIENPSKFFTMKFYLQALRHKKIAWLIG